MGKRVDGDDWISYILSGLNSAYTAFIISFNFATQDSNISFEDFQAEHLNYEILLGNHHQQNSNNADSGNFTLYSHKPKNNGPNFYKDKQPAVQNRDNNNQFFSKRPEGNNFAKSFSHGESSNIRTPCAPCQIYGKFGYQALDCFQRMNYSYQGRHPPTQLAALAAKPNSQIENSEEQPWYADSGANNHIIAALENLAIQEPYKGDDEIAVGNGSGLPIMSTGYSTLFHSNKPFHMKNIFHCPSVAANLLSIQKFCLDNNC